MFYLHHFIAHVNLFNVQPLKLKFASQYNLRPFKFNYLFLINLFMSFLMTSLALVVGKMNPSCSSTDLGLMVYFV